MTNITDNQTIAEIQNRFIKAGFQFQEHIYNDGHERDCSIEFTRCRNRHHFGAGRCMKCDNIGEVGWGRFPRLIAWSYAGEWLKTFTQSNS